MNKVILFFFILFGLISPSICFASADSASTGQKVSNFDAPQILHIESPGTLSALVDEDALGQVCELKVTGNVNREDVSCLMNIFRSSLTPCAMDFGEVNYIDGVWYGSYPNLISIILPSNVTAINQSTFRDCGRLVDITLPDRITEIGKESFQNCISLTDITIPKSVTIINDGAFRGCTNLNSVIFHEGLVTIEKSAFFGCKSLENVVLPDGVNRIGASAFHDCSKLCSIRLPKGITYISSDAFSNCINLRSITIPERVTSIDNNAFYKCENLVNVVLPEGIVSIKDNAFGYCRKLESINFPETITEIRAYAFVGCRIGDVTLLGDVTLIGNQAFYNVDKLELSSRKSPMNIGQNIVSDQSLIVVHPDAYSEFCKLPNVQRLYQLGHIVSGNTILVQTICTNAMKNMSSILSVMGEDAMASVYRLTIKGSINGYDIMIMRNKMPNLMHIDLTDAQIVGNPYEYYPQSHTEDNRLGVNSFRDMKNLRSVKLPRSITYIDNQAFMDCINLRNIELYDGIRGIGDEAFYCCSSLLEVNLPPTVRIIGSNAFYGCEQLESVILSEGLLSIEGAAFATTGLQSINLPSTVERIGPYAFDNCQALKEVYLPHKLREIRGATFKDCASLEKIHIPPLVEIIGSEAFGGKSQLKDVYVFLVNPNDINIDQDTFSNWQGTTLHVPTFSYNKYYIHPKWGQFLHIEQFDEKFEAFYTKSLLTIDQTTGVIDGTPDAILYEHGCLAVNDQETQNLDEVTLIHDGADCATLIPEDTGNIIAEKISIEINVRANNWHFFCFPFDIDLSSISYEGDYVWRQYDGAARSRREGGWQDLPDGTTRLKAGRGYIFQGTKAGVLHLEANHPTITGDDVYTGLKNYATEETTPADASWNFIGNPYTSYYAVDEDTYNAPITVWTGKGYEAYRPGDDDYEFAPYEAFFVQTPASSNTINFNADNREGYEQAQETQSNRRMARAQKKVNPNRLLVNLELGVQGDPSTGSGTSEYLDKTRVVFNDECSSDYESDCDAAKFFSDERRAELYTIGSDGTQYAINERPEDGGYVDLGFVANQKGKYSISAPRMDVPMLLVDDVMETTFDLRNGAYEFSSAKGTFNKRFYLKRYEGITTSIKDLADQIGMNFCISDGTISIEGLNDTTRVCLYNMAGQQIATQQGNGTFIAIPGTYVISVGKLSAKIIVK